MRKPQLPLDGGCQCGSVRYRVNALPLFLYACHCTNCQRQSGSAFALSMTVPTSAFEVIQGEPKAWRRASRGGTAAAWFCDQCGIRLYGERDTRPHTINVRAGTLDDTSWIEPGAHIFMASAQPWERIGDPSICFDEMPDDFAPLAKTWRDRIS